MRTLSLAVVATLLAVPAVSSADDKKAEKLIDQGISLREKQKDREALKKFEEAFAIDGSGRAQAQMALAHQALGDWLAAQQNLSAALKTKHPWIAKNRGPLEGALKTIEGRLGRVEVNATAEGAKVKVNGRDVGETPLPAPVFVVAGSVIVQVEKAGFFPVSRQIQVAAGSLARENVKLVQQTQAAAPPPPKAAPPKAAPPKTAPPTAQTDVGGGDDSLTYVGYGLAGGAAVGIGLGVTGLIIRNGKINEYNDDACLVGGRTRDENCSDKLDSANSAETLMLVGFIAGGAMAAGSAVVLILAGGSGGDTAALDGGDAPTWACGPGPGEIGAGCAFRF